MAARSPTRSFPRVLAVVGGIALSAGAEPAAADVTVGSALGARADLVTSCRSPGGCTAAAAGLGGRPVAIGADGVIVRWRIRAATRGTAALRVLRPEAGGAYASVGAGPRQLLAKRPRAGRDAAYVFAVRIPVQRGDRLAVDLGRGPAGVYHLRREAGFATLGFEPAITGDQPRVATSALDGAELLINADVELDADGDGFGDETQDNCPTIPNDQTTNPCPSTAVPPSGSAGPGSSGARRSRTTRFRRHKPVRRSGFRAVR